MYPSQQLLTHVVFSLLASCVLSGSWATAQSDSNSIADHFELHIRPILADKCLGCHGSTKQWAGLRLDSKESLSRGGENGPVVLASNLEASPILERILSKDPDQVMPPPDSKLTLDDRQKDQLSNWVLAGAWFPEKAAMGTELAGQKHNGASHWAFQPPTMRIPEASLVGNSKPSDHWIDTYLNLSLAQHQLDPLGMTDRRTMLRRLHLITTGLLPTWEQVQAFEQDARPDAWERVVDELLFQSQYAEKWARFWMDLARYSDTKGYVYGREDRTFVFSRAYRDWLVEAFESDLPYDEFIRLQLAADQLVPPGSPDLAALGFLTLGRRFLAIQYDIIDDRIDTTFRGLMGLTVQCARCHDHKYDPISANDYYALAGVFQSCIDLREEIPLHMESQSVEFRNGLSERKQKLRDLISKHRAEANDRIETRFADYLETQVQIDKYPEGNFNQLSTKDDLIPALVHRWEWYLGLESVAKHPVMRIWTELSRLSPSDATSSFQARALEKLTELAEHEGACHPDVLKEFSPPPESLRAVADRYGKVIAQAKLRWQAEKQQRIASGSESPSTSMDPQLESLRWMLLDRQSGFYIPDEPIDSTEWLWDNGTCVEIWKAQAEIDQWLMQSSDRPPVLGVLKDRQLVSDARLLRRGNANLKGEAVPRGFFQFMQPAFGDTGIQSPGLSFQQGSGRLEMARLIADRRNPLTARVWVNRVWQQVFGEGLVQSASDFGLRSDKPSHPELLDALAIQFMDHGWSTRWLIRELVNTDAFRRSSIDLVASSSSSKCQEHDPANRLLWRFNPHRLTWEECRDSLSSISGSLLHRIGGKSVDPLASDPASLARRTIYTTIDRQYLPMTLQNFDFANPDMHNPKRSETVIPQQALFLLNHPLPAQASMKLVEELQRSAAMPLSDTEFVTALYHRVLQRNPRQSEVALALEFLGQNPDSSQPPEVASGHLPLRAQLAQVLLIGNEAIYID